MKVLAFLWNASTDRIILHKVFDGIPFISRGLRRTLINFIWIRNSGPLRRFSRDSYQKSSQEVLSFPIDLE